MSKLYVVGKSIQYSLSPIIYNFYFERYNLNYTYDILNIDNVENIFNYNFKGINITIPYKEKILYLDKSIYKSEIVKKFKLTNIYCNNKFDNTDYIGLIELLKNISFIDVENIVIFGSGAMSSMVKKYLYDNTNIKNIYVCSRKNKKNTMSYEEINKMILDNYTIINCSPMGLSEIKIELNDDIFKNSNQFIDLNYTPYFNILKKKCIKYNIKYKNGLDMLFNQANHAFEIFTNIKIDNNIKKKCLSNLYFKSTDKIIVIGMPFCGKSTLYKEINSSNSIDLDEYISQQLNISIFDFIKKNGINKYRKIENYYFKKVLKNKEINIIFTGGGTLSNYDNILLLKNELVIYLEEKLSILQSRFDKSRANIKNMDQLNELFKFRNKLYINISILHMNYTNLRSFINENSNN